MRGDYAADGALYTVEAKSYEPNDFNLYNMAGNVSEWTESSYDAGAYEFVSTMNPNVADKANQRKVIRGGSWKDVAFSYKFQLVISNMQIQQEAISVSEQYKIIWVLKQREASKITNKNLT